jgi:hypothetical protein
VTWSIVHAAVMWVPLLVVADFSVAGAGIIVLISVPVLHGVSDEPE